MESRRPLRTPSGVPSGASRIGVGVTAINRFANNGQHSRGSCWGISGTSPSSAT